jgi:alcohol dehydrogenase, propanol-preferring
MGVVGLFGGTLPVPLPALASREVSLRGSKTGTTAQIRELVQRVREGRLRLPAVQMRPRPRPRTRCATCQPAA